MVSAFTDGMALKLFGCSISSAHSQGICVSCKSSIRDERETGEETGENGQIYSDAGMHEYQISGLCETCYDSISTDCEEY